MRVRRTRPQTDASRRRSAARLEALEQRVLLSAIPLPIIPANTFNILSYGAVGDNSTNNTTAIQDALNAAKNAGGGTVLIPSGTQETFLSGPITVYSNTNLQIAGGAVLRMLAYGTYPSSSTPFIYLKNDSNVEISGSGTIDGQGAAWWSAYNSSKISRPQMVKFSGSDTVLITGVTLTNAPTEQLVLDSSNDVTIDNITITAPSNSPNTDGIDPSGSNYLIENCTIDVGDDNIAVKPQVSYCSNITITGCSFGSGHGLSVGGETNHGLNGMTVTDCTFNGTVSGLRLKAARGQGGLVENISYSDITMTNVQYPININSYYNVGTIPNNPQDPAQTVTSTTPIWQNISISNFTSTDSASNSYCGVIWGLPEEPVNTVALSNVQISAHYGMDIDHVRNVSFDSQCQITPQTGGDLISTNSAATPYDAVVVEAGWTDQDVGSPATAGSSLFNPDNGDWTLNGAGAGLSGTADQFNLADEPITGDGILQARLSSLSQPSGSAPQAGVIFRAGLSGDDPFAALVQTPGDQLILEYRTTAGGTIASTALSGVPLGQYLKIVRAGNDFSAYYSANGVSWTQVGASVNLSAMPATADAGLVVASGTSALSTAAFSNVSVGTGPSVVTAAAANPNPVTAATTQLSVLGGDNAGESSLTYAWSVTGPALVTYSDNGDNAAKQTTVTFAQAGDYNFTVTITDADGLSTTSSVDVAVEQTLASMSVMPAMPTIATGATEQFSVSGLDQFGNAMTPANVTWSVTGSDNSIDDSGLLTAGSTAGAYTVTAVVGAVQGDTSVTLLAAPAVTGYQVNDGNVQRAMVDSLTVTFSEPVTLADGAITLSQRGSSGGSSTAESFTLSNPSGDLQTYVLTFVGPQYLGNSLPNGVYDLTVHASLVQDAAGSTLAGGDQTFSFYRLYGDFYGTGVVDFNSLLLVAQHFGQSSSDSGDNWISYLDINGDGVIDFTELLAIAQTFGQSLSV